MPTIDTEYGIRTHLDLSVPAAIEKVTDALKAEGFGILTEIDVQATLKKKLDANFREYVILGACNPMLANQALNCELEIGLLLPCNVIVYADDNAGSVVSLVDPMSMLGVVVNSEMNSVATEARQRLERVAAALVG